jgi:putative ABC transport system substrate-binding protein
MRRREFITLLGGAAATWPLAVRAQQPARLPTVGFLGAASPSAWISWTGAFVERLRELGWIEGHTVAIEYRWAEGRSERFAEIAAEFVRLKVEVIVTGGAAGPAVKRATSTIPIVFAIASDPIGDGLVMSLARPGGNLTGLSVQAPDLAGKRLGLLREVFPRVRRLAVLVNVDYPAAILEMREVQATARTLGLGFVTLEIRQAEDIASVFAAYKGDADRLRVGSRILVSSRGANVRQVQGYPKQRKRRRMRQSDLGRARLALERYSSGGEYTGRKTIVRGLS